MSSSVSTSIGDNFALSHEVRLHFLRSVAKPGRGILRGLTDGSEGVTLHAQNRNSKGQYTVRSKVISSSKIRFTLPPFNFFENGRTLRNGRREPGKFIITKKFPNLLNPVLQSLVNKSDDRILQKELNKL